MEVSQKEINNLLKCIQNKNTVYVKEFFDAHKNLHWSNIRYDKTGDSLLHYAAKLNLVDIIEYFLKNFEPSMVNYRNKDDKTALHEAAQFGQFEACKKLIEFQADVNALKRADWTPLMLTCTKLHKDKSNASRYDIVRLFLQNKVIVNFKNKDGWTCLHLISREGGDDILKLLIQYGIDVKAKTNNGRTALHLAALHGNKNIILTLLNLDLNVNVKDSCGSTPLHEGVLGNNLEICKILIEKGADVTARNNCGYSLIHLAASEGYLNIMKYLVEELNFNVNESTKAGITALHCAARKNKVDAYECLVKFGADEAAVDNCGRTAADYLL